MTTQTPSENEDSYARQPGALKSSVTIPFVLGLGTGFVSTGAIMSENSGMAIAALISGGLAGTYIMLSKHLGGSWKLMHRGSYMAAFGVGVMLGHSAADKFLTDFRRTEIPLEIPAPRKLPVRERQPITASVPGFDIG